MLVIDISGREGPGRDRGQGARGCRGGRAGHLGGRAGRGAPGPGAPHLPPRERGEGRRSQDQGGPRAWGGDLEAVSRSGGPPCEPPRSPVPVPVPVHFPASLVVVLTDTSVCGMQKSATGALPQHRGCGALDV